jgi:hypothetical protein
MPLFSDGSPCGICGHTVRQHKKWSPNGALDERCNDRKAFWDPLVGKWAIGRCKCPGYSPPKINYSKLRCTVCSRSVNKFHEINKKGVRRCNNCGALFGDEWAHFDLESELRR